MIMYEASELTKGILVDLRTISSKLMDPLR